MVGQGGDGGTVDIGFACLSGMFERNDDVLFVCYDNEAYMNTGVQRSGATPPAARTANTKPVGGEPGNVFGQGKNVPLIAMAHEIPYVATATVAELRDLEAKVERAMELRGARYLHVFVPCPLGWGSASKDTIRIARLAKETGLFPVFEAEHGDVVARLQDPPPGPGRGVPAAAAPLRAPVRRRRPARRDRAAPGERRPQHRALRPARREDEAAVTPGVATDLAGESVDEPLRPVDTRPRRNLMRLLVGDPREPALMEKPFAITLDVGSSLANKTGSWRTERAVYVDRLPPCNHACPAGENIQHWLYHAEEGGEGYERAWRQIMEDNPFPAIMGRVCYHPCETACNRGAARRGGRHQLGRALPRRRGDQAGLAGRARRRALGQAGARRRRRAVGALGRLPPRPARARGDDPRGRARWPAG